MARANTSISRRKYYGLVLNRAIDRTFALWSFEKRHIPQYLLAIAATVVAFLVVLDRAEAVVELRVLAISLAPIAAAVFATFLWQFISAPATLHFEIESRLKKLEKQAREQAQSDLNVFEVGVQHAEERLQMMFGGSAQPTWGAKYIKVGVRARNAKVRVARAYLIGVSHESNGLVEPGPKIDPINLVWSLTNGAMALDIESGIDRYFDVLKCSEKSPTLVLPRESTKPVKLEGYFAPERRYILDLAITSEDGPTTKLSIEIGWNGKWDEVTAKLLSSNG